MSTRKICFSGMPAQCLVSALCLILVAACGRYSEPGTVGVRKIADLGDTKLEYEIRGQGDPLVVLHGGPGLEYTYLFPALLELSRDHELICYQQRGTGASEGRLDSLSMTMAQFVQDLDDLRAYLGLEKMGLLGHSWGGALAVNYALHYPQHVRSLILVSSVGADSSCLTSLWANLAARTSETAASQMDSIQATQAFAENDPAALKANLRLALRAYCCEPAYADSIILDLRPYSAANFFLLYSTLVGELGHYDIHGRLNELTCPVLFVHGESDPLPIEDLELMQAQIANSRFQHIPDCGHFPFTEAPQATMQAAHQFLSDL